MATTNIKYKQCLLYKRNPSGLCGQYHMAWIPEELAHKGKVVKIRWRDSKGWDDGWVVETVGTQMTEEYVLRHEKDYKTQAEASDITEWKKLELGKVKNERKE